jgi:hypothetical protein
MGDSVGWFPLQGSYRLLDPTTGAITDTDRAFIKGANNLDLTGEMVEQAFDPNYRWQSYLESTNPDDRNVLQYRPTGSWSDEPVVIYHDPAYSWGEVHWVMDGNAVLFHDPTGAPSHVIHRDGRISEVDIPDGAYFVSGTPDGWLMQTDNVTFVHFYEAHGNFNKRSIVLEGATESADYSSRVHLVWRTPLGATANSGSFAAADLDVYLMSNCDTVDYWFDWGDNVPGPVTVYEAPDNESEILAEIDTEVTILNGPICPSRASAWWIVQTDDDRRGWINETSPRSTERCPRDPRRSCSPVGTTDYTYGADIDVYDAPGGTVIDLIPPGDPFDIIAGPVCTGEHDTWMQIQTDAGISGWVLEGICGMG